MEIEITLNGETHRVPPGSNLQDLVDTIDFSGLAVSILVNRQIVSRRLWPQRNLQSGDRVDIVQAISGG